MKVKYQVAVNRDDRADLKAWIDDHDSENIDLVVIGAGIVAIYDSPDGPNRRGCGLASPDRVGMTTALDEALAKLRGKSEDNTPRRRA